MKNVYEKIHEYQVLRNKVYSGEKVHDINVITKMIESYDSVDSFLQNIMRKMLFGISCREQDISVFIGFGKCIMNPVKVEEYVDSSIEYLKKHINNTK